MKPASRQRVLRVCAVGLVLASAYHAVALVWPALDPSSSTARHALFVMLNLALAVGLWVLPRGFFWVFAALTLQQLHSHGRTLFRVLGEQHRLHWESVLVMITLPAMLWLLWQERQLRLARSRSSAAEPISDRPR
jgi:hypothetical protein